MARQENHFSPGTRRGPSENAFVPAHIITGRIVNVNIRDWSVDAVSQYGNHRFFDIQLSSPYFHYSNGEGFYTMPEVGALVWICKPSDGIRAPAFILGFQAPLDERKDETGVQAANYRSNRQNLNPGDMMLRTRDENFIILRRGGVVQIGATPATQRIFIPVQNIIRDFCENYQLFNLAGEMTWSVDRNDQTTTGDALTTMSLKVKNQANEPEHAALLTVGSHKDEEDVTLRLLIKSSGATGASTMIQCRMTKTGDVSWIVEKDFNITARKNLNLVAEEENFLLQAVAGAGSIISKKDLLLQSEVGALALKATLAASISAERLTVEAPMDVTGVSRLGASTAAFSMVRGELLIDIIRQIVMALNDPSKPAGLATAPGSPILLPGLLPFAFLLDQLLSDNKTS